MPWEHPNNSDVHSRSLTKKPSGSIGFPRPATNLQLEVGPGSSRTSLKSFMEKHPLLPHPVKLLMPKVWNMTVVMGGLDAFITWIRSCLMKTEHGVFGEVFIDSRISVVLCLLCPTSWLILQTRAEKSRLSVWKDRYSFNCTVINS